MSFSAAKAALVCLPPRRRDWHGPSANFPNSALLRRARVIPAPVLFCAILIAIFAPALAGAEILIEPQVGFHGVFQLGRPFPLEIALNNTGRPAEGTLDVQVWKGGATKGGAPYRVNYQREVFLGAQARKTIQLTVDPDFISRPLRVTFSSAAGRASRELDLRRHFSPAPVLLLMSESSALPPIAAAASSQSRLVSLAPSELASDPRALLGVSHLILYDQSLRDLSRSQLLALDTWLTAGGRMVIMGSLNFALYQEPAISRFLPVRVTGTKRVSFIPPAGKGERAVTLAGVWAQTSTVTSGKALAETESIPVLVEASRGRGRIIYLALDIGRPPLSQWDGLPRFLQTLVTPLGTDEPTLRTEWNDSVFAQLMVSPSFISTYVPSGSLLLAMTGYLLGIGVFTWLWQRKRLAPRFLLIGFVTFVTAGTVAGYVHFSHGGHIPDGVLLASTVLESSGDGFVEAQANLALFSTQLRQYDLQLERGWIDLTPVSTRSRETTEEAVVMQDGGGTSRYRLPLREWDYRLFRMRHIDRFPMRAELAAEGDKLVMNVDNQSVKDLTHCWLLVPGKRFDLGAIPRGASWRKVFPLANAKGQDDPAVQRAETLNFREVTFPDKTRDILFHSSLFPRDGDARWAGGAAVFFGWVKDPEPRVRVDDPRIQVQSYVLFRAIVPLASGEDE
jgi:hypothetical protein